MNISILIFVFAVIGAVGASITASFTTYSWWAYRKKAKEFSVLEEVAKKSKAGQISGQIRRQKKIDGTLGRGLLEALSGTLWMIKKIPFLAPVVEELEANPDRVLPTLNTLIRSPLMPQGLKDKILKTLQMLIGTSEDQIFVDEEVESYL